MFRKLLLLSLISSTLIAVNATSASASSEALCANKVTGVVRAAANGKCRARTERKVTVGTTGATGATGATGPTGATGATGPAGTFATTQSINTITSSTYTLVAADAGKLLIADVLTEIKVPTDAQVNFAIGTRIDIGKKSQAVFISGNTGATVNGSSAAESLDSATYQAALLVKVAANTWLCFRFMPT